jgi:WD40 repeat protein
MLFSHDYSLLFSGGRDFVIKIWSMPNMVPLSQLVGHTDTVFCLSLNSKSTLLYSGGLDASIRIWNAPWRDNLYTE